MQEERYNACKALTVTGIKAVLSAEPFRTLTELHSTSVHLTCTLVEAVVVPTRNDCTKSQWQVTCKWLSADTAIALIIMLTCDCHVTSTHSEACHTAPQCRRDGRHMYHKCSHRGRCCRDCHMGRTVQDLKVMNKRKKYKNPLYTTIQCPTIHKTNNREGCTRCYSLEQHLLLMN